MIGKMSSRGRRRQRRKREFEHTVHALPGTVKAVPDSPLPAIKLLGYGVSGFEEREIANPAEIESFRSKYPVIWVDIDGLGDASIILEIGKMFGLHELALEDSVNLRQRAKVEAYDNQLFAVMRMATIEDDHPLLEQLSLFLGHGFLVSLQEGKTGDVLEPVRERLRKGIGVIRSEGADYLLYSIVDAVIDGYFPVVEALGENLEVLEDKILEGADRYTPSLVLEMKRSVLSVRRAIWPARDAVNILVRDETDLIAPKTRMYFRDCHDHALRIFDLVENQRELCSDLMDLHLSSINNRMSEVMKVLTVITLLFMPATLIAGIYGMNFDTKYPLNMPELKFPYGYFLALAMMAVTALCFYGYANKKGWIADENKKGS